MGWTQASKASPVDKQGGAQQATRCMRPQEPDFVAYATPSRTSPRTSRPEAPRSGLRRRNYSFLAKAQKAKEGGVKMQPTSPLAALVPSVGAITGSCSRGRKIEPFMMPTGAATLDEGWRTSTRPCRRTRRSPPFHPQQEECDPLRPGLIHRRSARSAGPTVAARPLHQRLGVTAGNRRSSYNH